MESPVTGLVFIATSLDGFIARENGDIDWLPQPGSAGDEDYGYREFFDSIDAMVMGRNTFEKVLSFNAWPYGAKPLFVLTTRPIDIPQRAANSVEILSGAPADIAARISTRGLKRLYIDGGKTIRDFLQAGLVHELIITRIPILIGKGIPLFGSVSRDIRLKHVVTRQYADGLVQSRYEVIP